MHIVSEIGTEWKIRMGRIRWMALGVIVCAWCVLCMAGQSGAVEQDGQTGTGQAGAAQETSAPGESAGEQETSPLREEKNLPLYAKSAVLMDARTHRVLYGKDAQVPMPMASTTKIMTCILALELGSPEDTVTVSSYASSMPKVHLGMVKDEQFKLEDLLYSLMLESHNDSAVAIAEHIGGSVEGFAALMNQKARDLGCYDTFFVTPNGLDASITGEDGQSYEHHTTARDLARIMSYCILESPMKEQFLAITRTPSHSFTDIGGSRQFSCSNHNSFLGMMDGALSGKTGFTAKAGYCYVGALERDGKCFVVALLACGWPNNKSYKWKDTRQLMEYGLEEYDLSNVCSRIPEPASVPVTDGQQDTVEVVLEPEADTDLSVLMGSGEQAVMDVKLPEKLSAPVEKGQPVGTVEYSLDGELIVSYALCANETVEAESWLWWMGKLMEGFLAWQ